MRVNVYELLSVGQQSQKCVSKLRTEWMKESIGRLSHQYPQATAEAIDAQREHFPLKTLIGSGEVVAYTTEGEGGEFYTMAVIKYDDASVDSVELDQLEAL